MANANLNQAKRAKQDEFYTRLEDISDELYHYRHHFQGKSVFLNCDDPEWSNFWRYFELNFDDLGLTRLVSTHYHPTERTYKLVMERDENGDITTTKTPLEGNGDFRSAECVALLDEADIITTNPPFSLFREYLALLIDHQKTFLIIGNQNCITYKEVFPLLQNQTIWLGHKSGAMEFEVPKDYSKIQRVDNSDPDNERYFTKLGNICWFTNMDIDRRHEPMTLWRDYTPADYPRYVNCNAIEVSKVNDIPCDYYGVMGVPITFLDKHCPSQFEIVGYSREVATPIAQVASPEDEYQKGGNACYIRTAPHQLRRLYGRILIRRVDQPDARDEGE